MDEEIMGGEDPSDMSENLEPSMKDGGDQPPPVQYESETQSKATEPVSCSNSFQVSFDPAIWANALEKVIFPETLGTGDRKSSKKKEEQVELKFQVWIMADRLRLTGRHKGLSCEVECKLENKVEGLPEGGLGFSISSARLLPFFYKSRLPLGSGRASLTRQLDYFPYDGFEFEPAKALLHLRQNESHYQLPTEAPFALTPLPRVEESSGTPIRSIGALTAALRSCFFINDLKARRKPNTACFQDGACSALHANRAVHFASEGLAGLNLSVALESSPRLVAMLRRLKDPCRLDFFDGRAIIDDGMLRCEFPATPAVLSPFNIDTFLSESPHSSWKVSHAELSRLYWVSSIAAEDESTLQLKIVDEPEGSYPPAHLECELIENRVQAIAKVPLLASRATNQTGLPREARVKFRDFANVFNNLKAPNIGLLLSEHAVIFRDENEGAVAHFGVPREEKRI